MTDADKNHLLFGDNLDALRRYVDDGSVDLVYLDQPFNSNRNDSAIFNKHAEVDSTAQLEAFEDTWHSIQGKRPMLPSMYTPDTGAKKQKVKNQTEGLWLPLPTRHPVPPLTTSTKAWQT